MFVRNSAQIVATGGQKVSFSIASSRQLRTAVDGRTHNIFVSGMPERALVDMDCLRHYLARSYAVVRSTEEEISVHVMQGLLGGMEEPRRVGPQLNRQELLRLARDAITEAETAIGKEVVVFMGDTGAGKSTLINALSGVQMEQVGAVVRAAPGHREVALMQRAENDGRSTTFRTHVYFKDARPQAEHHFVDCGGFGDTNVTPEKKFIVPLSAALTLRKAGTIRFILCMSWGALDHKQGKALIKLMKTVYDSLGSLITPAQSEAISRQTILLFTKTGGRVTTGEALQRANTIYTNKIAIWAEEYGEEEDGEAIPPPPLSLRCLKNIIDQGNILPVDVLDVETMNRVKQAISRIPKIENPQSVFRLPQGEVKSILNDIMADVVRGKNLYNQLKEVRAQAASLRAERVALQAQRADLDGRQAAFNEERRQRTVNATTLRTNKIAEDRNLEETNGKILTNERNIEEIEQNLAAKRTALATHIVKGESTHLYHTVDTGHVEHHENKKGIYQCPYSWSELKFNPPRNNPKDTWWRLNANADTRLITYTFRGKNGDYGKWHRGTIGVHVANKHLPAHQQQIVSFNTDITNYEAQLQLLRTNGVNLEELRRKIAANITTLERDYTTIEDRIRVLEGLFAEEGRTLADQEQDITRREVSNRRDLNAIDEQIHVEVGKFVFAYQFLSLVDDPGIRTVYPVTQEFVALYQLCNP